MDPVLIGAVGGAIVGTLLTWLILKPRRRVSQGIYIVVPKGTSDECIGQIACQLIPNCTPELAQKALENGFLRFYDSPC